MTSAQTGHEICLFAFSAVCYSASFWTVKIKFTPQRLGMTLYQCAKFLQFVIIQFNGRINKKQKRRKDRDTVAASLLSPQTGHHENKYHMYEKHIYAQ